MATKLDGLVREACAVQQKIDALPERPKLTVSAYLKLAKKQAKVSDADLNKLEQKLTEPGAETVASFVKRLGREVVESCHYGEPPVNPRKLVSAYGRDETQADLNSFGVSALAALALAARHTAERSPESFGDIADMTEHRLKVGMLQEQLQGLCEKMREQYSGADLRLDTEGLTVSERDRGLCRAFFRRWPEVGFHSDWPQALIRAEMSKGLRKQLNAAARSNKRMAA